MANVLIDIASEFTGNKAFKQAETATEKLTKGVKTLAKTFGLAFGTAQVIAFGKASIKAAAADQKAQQQLALALKNVGLERDAASAEGFIQRLQSEFGIVDDKLRPAYQSLAIATRDTAEAQRLLNLSLDISAATGKDLSSVTAALSRGFLGNTTALSRLGVGISKADLKAKSFYEITSDLATTFEGSATAAANTFQGSIDKLGVAASNAQEIIGVGLIDALKSLGDENSVDNLADDMERAALASADFIRGLGQIGSFKVNGETRSLIGLLTTPIKRSLAAGPLGAITRIGEASRIAPKPFSTAMTVSGQVQLKQQKQITKLTQDQAKSQSKITKDKKLQAALDKANIALLKGEEVFDLDKIQVAAALTNQAQALGKATSAAQVLQIANDTARLNVKKSILALEDAIASKDEAAIIAATAKLNEDLKVLNALTNQKTQMVAIESILKGLAPKDLINQENLNEALRKIRLMLELLSQVKVPTITPPAGGGGGGGGGFIQTPNGIYPTTPPRSIEDINKANEDLGGVISVIGENGKEFIKLIDGLAPVFQTIEDSGAFNALVNSFAGGAINSFDAGSFRTSEGGSLFNSGAVGAFDRDVTITVVAPPLTDPNAVAEAIDQYLIDAIQRGTLRSGAY